MYTAIDVSLRDSFLQKENYSWNAANASEAVLFARFVQRVHVLD